MWLWKRNCRSLGIIFLLVIFLSSLISAKNITLEYPNKVNFNEEFSVSLNLENFSSDNYDIKLDIVSNGERIAQIYDYSLDKYKSTYYFINDAIKTNEKKVDLKLKIIKEFSGNAGISVKVRDSKGTTDSFSGYEIKLNSENQIVKEKKQVIEPNQEIKKEIKPINNSNQNLNEINLNNDNNDMIKNQEKVIYLTPQNIKNLSGNEILFESRNEKIKKYAIYGFAIFCILLIVLLILDKKKN